VRRWKSDMETDIKEILWKGLAWIYEVQGGDQ
jgi:hypothetical protein